MNYRIDEVLNVLPNNYDELESIFESMSEKDENWEELKKVLEKYRNAALDGELEEWIESTRGKLALIVLYDQAPRIIFDLDDERNYTTDEKALEITKRMDKSGEYKKLDLMKKMFTFFPYHHTEDIELQKKANKIFKDLYEKDPENFEWIYKSSCNYNEIIERFGRFPHRNDTLGREWTEEEKEFMENEWEEMWE